MSASPTKIAKRPARRTAPPTHAAVKQRRPGGRSRRVWEAVTSATIDLLIQRGYDEVAIPEVARLAGVNPTSIYRRWGSREGLMIDVLGSRAEAAFVQPDTGTLRADLIAYLTQAAVFLQTPYGSALLQLGALAMRRPELQPHRLAYWSSRTRPIRDLFDRAGARGEVPVGLDIERVVELLVGPLYVRVMFTGRAIDAGLIEAAVDAALQGLANTRAPAVRARRGSRPASQP